MTEREVESLPTAMQLGAPRATVEVIAIAVAVFALVQSVSTEATWLVVIWLALARRSLLETGHDFVLARRPTVRRRSSTRRALQ